MFKIENEMDLHCKVVHLIRNYYPNAIMVAGLGENQDTPNKRIKSWKKGHMRGQPDLMLLNYHKDYNGLCTEFKSPTNNYQISDAQKQMKERCKENCYKFILSNDYDYICMQLRRYNEETKFSVTPSFVLTHSSDSIYVCSYINIWLVFVFLVNIAQEHSLIKKHWKNIIKLYIELKKAFNFYILHI